MRFRSAAACRRFRGPKRRQGAALRKRSVPERWRSNAAERFFASSAGRRIEDVAVDTQWPYLAADPQDLVHIDWSDEWSPDRMPDGAI